MTILVALIVSAVSGVLGVLLQKMLSRGKPVLDVTALSFKGNVIEINDDVQFLSRKCHWSNNISKYITYEELLESEVVAAQTVAMLKLEKENVDRWLEILQKDMSNKQFNKGQVLGVPVLDQGEIILSTLFTSIKRQDFPHLPNNLDDLKELDDILAFDSSSTGWKIHCGHFQIPLEKEGVPVQEVESLEKMVFSIVKADKDNIIALHEYFSNFSGAQIYNYEKLLEEIKLILVNNAHLSMKLSISNLGQSPIVLKPYFSAKVEFGERTKTLLLENSRPSTEGDKVPFIKKVRSKKYKHSTRLTNFVSVSGGETIEIDLVSIDGLKEESSMISEFYELGALKGQVFAKTGKEKIVKSRKLTFGKGISEVEKKELIKIAT